MERWKEATKNLFQNKERTPKLTKQGNLQNKRKRSDTNKQKTQNDTMQSTPFFSPAFLVNMVHLKNYLKIIVEEE